MKRMFSVVVIIALIGGTPLWAIIRGSEKGRYYNRDLQKRSGHANWAKCIGKDSDAPISAEADIVVDVDKPWEWPPQRYGVHYTAYSSVSGEAFGGTYSLYADVPNGKSNGDSKSGNTDGWTFDFAHDSDFDWWESVNAEDKLSNCTAWGNISGASRASEPYLHKARAEAWKFPVKGKS